jgi:hypothetical protein
VTPLHGAVPGKYVFEYARLYVMSPGAAVGSGWAFVKHPRLVIGRLFEGFFEDAVLLPEIQNLVI